MPVSERTNKPLGSVQHRATPGRSVCQSNGTFSYSSTLSTLEARFETKKVWPSVARAALPAPIRPPTPGMFSITTDCPNLLCSGSCRLRATMSLVPPAAPPEMKRRWRVGHAGPWPKACPAKAGNALAPSRDNSALRFFCMDGS